MTRMDILLILNIVGALFILSGFLFMLPWRDWLYKKFGDNPEKARVYVRISNKYRPVNGEYKKTVAGVAQYEYKWRGQWRTVNVPAGYPDDYVPTGRRLIFVNSGDLIASLPGSGITFQYDQATHDKLIGSRIAVDLVNSLSGKLKMSIMIFVLIAVLAVGAYFLFTNMNKVEPVPAVTSNYTMPPIINPVIP